mmetsp:Transcript_37736/g.84368  ORF Transcript_37736/g.84368 Transcript_37736/m.84368 type:complete len:209 (+) Transcript_37736:1010-1636(+)
MNCRKRATSGDREPASLPPTFRSGESREIVVGVQWYVTANKTSSSFIIVSASRFQSVKSQDRCCLCVIMQFAGSVDGQFPGNWKCKHPRSSKLQDPSLLQTNEYSCTPKKKYAIGSMTSDSFNLARRGSEHIGRNWSLNSRNCSCVEDPGNHLRRPHRTPPKASAASTKTIESPIIMVHFASVNLATRCSSTIGVGCAGAGLASGAAT